MKHGKGYTVCTSCDAKGGQSWIWNDKLGKHKTCYHCNQPWSVSKASGTGKGSKSDAADPGGLRGEELDIMVSFLSEGTCKQHRPELQSK